MTIDWDNCPSNTSFLEDPTDPENRELSEAETAEDQLRKALEAAYTTDKLGKQIKFNAVCLRKLKDEEENLGLVRVKARIPEIHSLLPKPKSVNDYATMSLYPTFIALKNSFKDGVGDSAEDIPPGTNLLVTFGSMSNFGQPRILEIGNIIDSRARSNAAALAAPPPTGSAPAASAAPGAARGSSIATVSKYGVVNKPEKLPNSQKNGITRVGAWASYKNLFSPNHRKWAIARAKKIGLNYVSIFVNRQPNSKTEEAKRKTYTFTIAREKRGEYRRKAIIAAVREWQDAGFEVGLATWMRPNEEWISGIIDDLTPIAIEAGAKWVDLDIEEPWFRGGVSESDLLELDTDFANRWTNAAAGKIDLRLSAITVSKLKLIPDIMNTANIITPQAYITNRYKKYVCGSCPNPYSLTLGRVKKLWIPHTGGKTFSVGLAAYKQDNFPPYVRTPSPGAAPPPAPGATSPPAIRTITWPDTIHASLLMARNMGATDVCYWVLDKKSQLHYNKMIKAIKQWRD
jgi:hypothetical protein